MTLTPSQPESPWPHRTAVMLVCATFPLIWVGGLVTTYQAGMAVPDWPSTYGYNLFLYPWDQWIRGPWALFIEHAHRLLGATVGLLTIALVAVLFRRDSRSWVRVLGCFTLLGVIAQGVLGGMRVLFDEVQLARLHACMGPAFFALTVALAVFTSRRWRESTGGPADPNASKLHRLAALTTGLVYFQLVLGAHVRHLPPAMSPGAFRVVVMFHLLIAAVLTVHVVLLLVRLLRCHRDQSSLVGPAVKLTLLMFVQLILGCATWVMKYSWPVWFDGAAWTGGFIIQEGSLPQVAVATAHVAIGSLILVTTLVVTLRSFRLVRRPSRLIAGSLAVCPLLVGPSLIGSLLVCPSLIGPVMLEVAG